MNPPDHPNQTPNTGTPFSPRALSQSKGSIPPVEVPQNVSLEAAFRTFLQALIQQANRCKSCYERLASDVMQVEPAISRQSEVLATIQQAAQRIESNLSELSKPRSEPPLALPLDPQVSQLLRIVNDQGRVLEQIRMQVEAVARTQDKLSSEVIERQVRDGYHIQLARLYEELACYANGTSVGVNPALRRIETVLEEHNVILIYPVVGESFDPRHHQATGRTPTVERAKHNCISATFNLGLRSFQRVIQSARVEVFAFEESSSVNLQP